MSQNPIDMTLLIVAYLAFFVAAAWLTRLLMPSEEDRLRQRHAMDHLPPEWGDEVPLLKWVAPLVRAVAPFTQRLPLPGWRQRLQFWAMQAGLERQAGGNDILALQVVLALLFPVIFQRFLETPVGQVGAVLAGAVFPVVWLYDKKKERQKEIVINLPNVADLLALMTQAGMAFEISLQRLLEMQGGKRDPLIEELRLLMFNRAKGMAMPEALEELARRVDQMDVNTFTATLIQAHKMGAPMANTLKMLADKLRYERFMRAEKEGATAAQKLLVPLVIFIFPLVFVIVVGPFILKYTVGG